MPWSVYGQTICLPGRGSVNTLYTMTSHKPAMEPTAYRLLYDNIHHVKTTTWSCDLAGAHLLAQFFRGHVPPPSCQPSRIASAASAAVSALDTLES